MRVLVTGGTGVLGRQVVQELLRRGVPARVLSRKARPLAALETVQGDLLEPSTLPAALDGVEGVIHCASNPARPKEDPAATRNLIAAAHAAGVRHLVLISIVGIDGMRWNPYYRAKLEQERLVEAGGVPYTLLRAAQFHDFVAFLLRSLGRGGVQWLPAFTLQPVDTEAVAARLVEAALGRPAGRLPDLVGPEPRTLASLGQEWLAATGQRRRAVVIPLPGWVARAWRPVGGPEAERAGRSWGEWLAQQGAQTQEA